MEALRFPLKNQRFIADDSTQGIIMNDIGLHNEYEKKKPIAIRYAQELSKQLSALLISQKIALAVPVVHRVKTWESIRNNIDERDKEIESISNLNDFIGLRIILLFLPDVSKVCELLKDTLRISKLEDTSGRLGDSEFGYQSKHLEASLPYAWLSLPTFTGCEGLSAEIQVRTTAQHIWAAASRKLQYKSVNAIPLPIRRSINRVAALLEIVDLEFERVLSEKDDYSHSKEIDDLNGPLNIDLLQRLLDDLLGKERRVAYQPYEELLFELSEKSIFTVGEFKIFVHANIARELEEDAVAVKTFKEKGKEINDELAYEEDGFRFIGNAELIKNGIYKSQVGLVRGMLSRIKINQ